MTAAIRAWAAQKAGGDLQPFEYEPGALHPEYVDVRVEHCGVCHSDQSMLDNEWRRTVFPFVPGHEIVGVVTEAGAQVKGLSVGDRVGVGWYVESCMHCSQCMSGDHNLCRTGKETIVGRHGGFAERVRSHWSWAVKLPQGLKHDLAGPLFCGGITVFNPIVQFGVQPTHRVGVVGIGGLGHMALAFLNKWGCEVTAFTSSEAKRAEALSLGAHHAAPSNDKAALKQLAGRFDFILVTVNVGLDWAGYMAALKPRGHLHFAGTVMDPLNLNAFHMIGGQKRIAGSPVGSPATTATMLEFCARHGIAPVVERFPMSKVNDAIAHLRSGKARYRVVLDN